MDGFHPKGMRCPEVHKKDKLLLKSIKWTNILMTVHPRRVKLTAQQMDGYITKSNKMDDSPTKDEMS